MPERLLVLGGTFDPPHIGHLILAEWAREQFGGTILFLPAGDPWRKAGRVGASADHRLAMTELAAEASSDFHVDAREVNRPGASYTVDTLEELKSEGHDEIVLILGADALADMPNWKDPERIRALATIAVAAREGMPGELGTGLVSIAMPALDVSSTMVRERVGTGRSIRFLVPDAVRDYIVHHRLYSRSAVQSRRGTAQDGARERRRSSPR